MQTGAKFLRWIGTGGWLILLIQTLGLYGWQWLLGQFIYRMRYPLLSWLMLQWDSQENWLLVIGLGVCLGIGWPALNWLFGQMWRWSLGGPAWSWQRPSKWNWWRLGLRIGWWSWLAQWLVRLTPTNQVNTNLVMLDLMQRSWWLGLVGMSLIGLISWWFLTHPVTNWSWPWRLTGQLLLVWWLVMFIGWGLIQLWPVAWLAAGLLWWGQFSAMIGVSVVIGSYLAPNPRQLNWSGIGLLIVGVIGYGSWLIVPTRLSLQPSSSPALIAHRGVDHHDGVQNTLSALQKTQAVHPTWVEIDLHRTRDNQWVVFHDETLDQLTRQHGFPRKYRLQQLVGTSIREQGLQGQLVSFSQYLKVAHRQQQPLIIELKTTPADSNAQLRRFIQQYAATIKAHGDLIHTMDYQAVQMIKKSDPQLKVLSIQGYAIMAPQRLPNGYTMEAATLSTWWVHQAHQQHQRVYVWTVNQPLMIRPLMALGVDGIVTDQTTELRKTIKTITAEPLVIRQVRQYLWGI